MYGLLYYRSLEHDKTDAFKQSRRNFDRGRQLSDDSLVWLQWWVDNAEQSSNVIFHGPPSITLTTDSSLTGWRAVYANTSTGGSWSAHERSFHINYLELLAVFMGLKTFCKSQQNTNIWLLIDNTTAIAVLNHMGTSHSEPCHRFGKEIWEWCIDRNIWISAAHILGVHNTTADLRIEENKFWHRVDD